MILFLKSNFNKLDEILRFNGSMIMNVYAEMEEKERNNSNGNLNPNATNSIITMSNNYVPLELNNTVLTIIVILVCFFIIFHCVHGLR